MLREVAPSWVALPKSISKRVWIAVAVFSLYLLAYTLSKLDAGTDFGNFPEYLILNIAEPIDSTFRWTGNNLSWFFKPISNVISLFLAWFEDVLLWMPWVVLVGGTATLALKISGWRFAILCIAGLGIIGVLGLWDSAMITLSVMGISVLIAVTLAVPLGIAAALNNRFEGLMRPILDLMQVMPAFVWLMPALFLFGVSGSQAVFLTVVYAIAPTIRLTNLGIRLIPSSIIETARSHGSGSRQTLLQIQLPLAKPSIMMGINQTIMMAMAMVIITALVGTDGLGKEIWNSLRMIDSGRGLESGLAIVLLAVILDRISYGLAQQNTASSKNSTRLGRNSPNLNVIFKHLPHTKTVDRFWLPVTIIAFIGLLLVSGSVVETFKEFPKHWNASFADQINSTVAWMSVHLHFMTSWIRDSIIRELGMNPVKTFFLWLPWPAFLVGATSISYFVAGKKVAALTGFGTLFVGVAGIWDITMITLGQVLVAAVFTVSFGFVIGVWCSQSRRFEIVLRPFLDTMQTMPIFVYLVPVIMLWGIGPLVGVIATLVYALPPMIRMTNLGIQQVPSEIIETSRSAGASNLQTMVQVKMPLALPTIMMGVNQTIMMVLAMVIIAGLVGGGGLGQAVYINSIYLQIGQGFINGGAIVLIATILDRLTQVGGRSTTLAVVQP